MTEAEKHIENHAGQLTGQRRFSRLKLSYHSEHGGSIWVEGYVAMPGDFAAMQAEWLATKPPCATNFFVHIDPLGAQYCR